MPYSLKDIPDRIKGLPKAAQEIWIAAYNSAHEQYDGDEEKANATAWAAVKQKYEQDKDGKWKLIEAEASLDQTQYLVHDAVRARFGEKTYIKETFPDHVIVDMQGKYYKLNYTIDEANNVILADDITPVEPQYVELAEALTGQLIEAKDKQGWEWEVVLIQAGLSGNGFYYSPEVLREAAPLFEGVRALARADELHIRDVDKSVKNIVGWFSNPRFETNKVRARFHISEAADWLRTLMLDAWNRGKKDIVGFSIVGAGPAKTKRHGGRFVRFVEAIKSIDLVDIVVNPAAGGRIIKLAAAANQNQGEELETMNKLWKLIESKRPDLLQGLDPEKVTDDELLEKLTGALAQPNNQTSELGNQAGQELLAKAKKLLDDAKLDRCQATLTTMLVEAKLPELTTARIKKRFEGRAFEIPELEEEISYYRESLAQLSQSGQVRGLGHMTVGDNEPDKVNKALDGFFANQDVDGVSRFRSFREAYVLITGDVNLTGQLREARNLHKFTEALTSSSWAEILGDSITRRMLAEYKIPGLDDWRKIVSDVTSIKDFRTNRRMRMGGYGTLPGVSESGTYQNLTSPGDEEATYAISKKGGLEEITLEMIANDDVGAIRRIPQKMARTAARTLYKTIFDLIVDNPIIYDSVALFDATHNNLGSAALSANDLLTAKIAMGEQAAYGDSSEVLGLTPKYLLVPLEIEDIAYRLTTSPTQIGATNNAATEPNIHSSYGLEVIVVPYWTDDNDWALVCNPADCPTIEVGFFNGQEEPELFVQDQPTQGSMFSADKITYKIRHIYGVCVLDYRGMYKAVVV